MGRGTGLREGDNLRPAAAAADAAATAQGGAGEGVRHAVGEGELGKRGGVWKGKGRL